MGVEKKKKKGGGETRYPISIRDSDPRQFCPKKARTQAFVFLGGARGRGKVKAPVGVSWHLETRASQCWLMPMDTHQLK